MEDRLTVIVNNLNLELKNYGFGVEAELYETEYEFKEPEYFISTVRIDNGDEVESGITTDWVDYETAVKLTTAFMNGMRFYRNNK